MTHTTTASHIKVRSVSELPFLVRVIWFFVLGLEITAVWILVAWALNITIIGLPAGLWMLQRVPQVLTLKSRSGAFIVESNGQSRYVTRRQIPFLLRAIYFVLFGWWASLLWSVAAYLLCVSIIGLPFGLLMLNSLPFVTTLHQ